jgi:hypothetical protein
MLLLKVKFGTHLKYENYIHSFNTLTDKLCTLPLFKMAYIALDAFSARLI